MTRRRPDSVRGDDGGAPSRDAHVVAKPSDEGVRVGRVLHARERAEGGVRQERHQEQERDATREASSRSSREPRAVSGHRAARTSPTGAPPDLSTPPPRPCASGDGRGAARPGGRMTSDRRKRRADLRKRAGAIARGTSTPTPRVDGPPHDVGHPFPREARGPPRRPPARPRRPAPRRVAAARARTQTRCAAAPQWSTDKTLYGDEKVDLKVGERLLHCPRRPSARSIDPARPSPPAPFPRRGAALPANG